MSVVFVKFFEKSEQEYVPGRGACLINERGSPLIFDVTPGKLGDNHSLINHKVLKTLDFSSVLKKICVLLGPEDDKDKIEESYNFVMSFYESGIFFAEIYSLKFIDKTDSKVKNHAFYLERGRNNFELIYEIYNRTDESKLFDKPFKNGMPMYLMRIIPFP